MRDSQEEPSEEKRPKESQAKHLPLVAPLADSPGKMRGIDIEIIPSGGLFRRDCYDPDEAAEGGMSRPEGGELYARRLNWTRLSSRDSKVKLEGKATGLPPDEVEAGKLYPWPEGTPIRAFVE